MHSAKLPHCCPPSTALSSRPAAVADEVLLPAAKVFGALAVLALSGAAVLRFLVFGPRMRGDDRAFFPHSARPAQSTHQRAPGRTAGGRSRRHAQAST